MSRMVFVVIFLLLNFAPLLPDISKTQVGKNIVDKIYLAKQNPNVVDKVRFGVKEAQAAENPSELEYSVDMGPINGSTSANYVYGSFFNPSGSGKVFVIKRVAVRVNAVATATYQNLAVRRTTAVSAVGTQITAANIPKKNSDSSDSVANIRHTIGTTGVTFAGTTDSRILAQTAPGKAGQFHSFRDITFGENDEKIVLQQNEGIALYQEAAGDADQRYRLYIEWEEAASAPSAQNEFLFAFTRVNVAATANYTYDSFFNPVASGKTAVVKRVWFGTESCNGVAVYTNNISLRRTTSASGGTAITASNVPKKNTAGANSVMDFRRSGVTVGLAGSADAKLGMVTPCGTTGQPSGWQQMDFQANDEKLVLQQGEGIALMSEAAGDINQLVRMVVEWQEVPSASTPASQGEYMFAYHRVSNEAVAPAVNTTFYSFYNPVGSGKTAVVKKLGIKNNADTSATYSAFSWRRLTAATGGTQIAASDVPKKHTGTANSAMELRSCGTTCATPIGATYAGTSDSRLLTVNGAGTVGQVIGQREAVFGDNEKLVLQPGEGVGFYLDVIAGDIDHYVKAFVEWDEESSAPSSGGEYMIDVGPINGSTTSGYNYASFFNPAASGKTAIIKRVSLRIDSTTTAVYIPMTLRRSTSASGGTQITAANIPKKHASTANSAMEIRRTGVTVGLAGSADSRLTGVQTSGAAGTAIAPSTSGYKEFAFKNDERIILQPGEGVALYQEAAGSGNLRVKVLFEWEEVASGSTPASQGEYLMSTGPVNGSLNANYAYSSLFNPSGTGKKYVIKRIELRVNRVGTATAPSYIPATIRRTTASSGGTVVTQANVPEKHSGTATTTAQVSHTGPTVGFAGVTDSRLLGVTVPGVVNQYGDYESVIVYGDEMILKEGEGLALYQEAASGDANLHYRMAVEWSEVNSATGISISGSIYQSNESSLDTTAYAVKISVNNAAPVDATVPADGTYTYSSLTASAGNSISVYIYNHTNDANAYTVTDGSTSITGLNLYVGKVSIGSDNGSTATANSNICAQSSYPTASTPDDRLSSCSSNNITAESGAEWHVLTGKLYNTGASATLTTAGTGGDLHIDDSASATLSSTGTVAGNVTNDTSATLAVANGITLNVGGNWTNAGTFTANTSTINFNGAGTQTIGGSATTTFNNVTTANTANATTGIATNIGGTLGIGNGSTFTVAGYALTVTGATTVGGGTSGSLVISSATGTKTFVGLVSTAAGGTWDNSGNSDVYFRNGITNNATGTFTAGSGNNTFDTNSQALTGTLSIPNITVTGAAVVLTNNGTLTVSTTLAGTGQFTNGATGTLNYGSATIDVTTFSASTSGNTVNYNGAGQTVRAVTPYHHLILSGSGTKTLNASTTNINGDFTLSGTVSTTGVVGLTIVGTVTLGSGTAFTAGSYTHNIAGNWTNNGATFTSTGSTITFNGTGAQTITGTNTWNNLTINNSYTPPSDTYDVDPDSAQTVSGTLTVTDGQWTPNTGDSYGAVSIGTNGIMKPDSGVAITVNNGWSNTGTFTHNNGTVNFLANGASNYNITTGGNSFNNLGFNKTNGATEIYLYLQDSFTVAGDLTAQNNTNTHYYINASGTPTVTISGNLNFPNTPLFSGWTAYGLWTPSENFTTDVKGNYTSSDAEALVNGNITLSGTGTQTITDTTNFNFAQTFKIDKTSGTAELGSSLLFNNGLDISQGILDATTSNYDMTMANASWVNNGTFNGRDGTVTFVYDTALSGSGTFNFHNLTINNTKIMTAPSGNINVSGDWTNSGTFTHNSGTVNLTGAGGSTQVVSGDNTFNNLTATASSARTINFASGSTTTVAGTWTATGSSGQNITLGRNGGSGVDQWNINPTAWSVDYVTPANSNNQAGFMINPVNYTDGGNNTNWFVTNVPPSTPTSLTQGKTSGASDISESAWTNGNQPWFGFSVTDPDTSDTVKYRIQIDGTSSSFANLVLDYTYGSLSARGTTFAYQVGQSGGTYAVGSASMTLPDSSTGYWWRVYSIDNSAVQSVSPAYFGTQATMDMKVDTTPPSWGSVKDGTDNTDDSDNSYLASPDDSLRKMSAYWADTAPNFSVSGAPATNIYQYAIGTTQGGTDIKTWTYTGTSGTDPFIDASSLTLDTNIPYYFTVKAYDNAGNSSISSSDGQEVALTLSFSLNNNSITFANMNNPNWTSMDNSIEFTTKTNAKSGYSVLGYITDDLKSLAYPTQTIQGFPGTWTTPTLWDNTCKAGGTNYCGFGYATDDSSVKGSNRFNVSGGTPDKYSQFYPASSGDYNIMADSTAPTIDGGRALVNEVFKLFSKVSVSDSQAASTYQTTLTAIVTSNF